MPPFASPEWIALLGQAVHQDPALAQAPTEVSLVIELVLLEGPAWYVTIDGGQVTVAAGRAPAPTVTFTQSRATAAAVARGEDSAQAAFLRGDLRVGGDTEALVAQADSLSRISDLFASVRDQTDW